MRAAVRASGRATVRRQRTAVALMAVAMSLLFGGALGALAGARRSATALDRFLDEYGAEDVYLSYPEDGSLDPDAVHRLPQVRSAEHQSYLAMVPVASDGRPLTEQAGEVNPYLYDPVTESAATNRYRVVEGRSLDLAEPLEVLIDLETAAARHLSVGSRLPMAAYAPSQEEPLFNPEPGAEIPDPAGPVLDLEVVGIVRMPVDIHPDDEERTTSFGGTQDIYLTPALFDRYGDDLLVFNPPVEGSPEALRLVRGALDVDGFTSALHALPGGEGAQVQVSDSDTLDSARNARRAIAVETTVLYVLAGVLAGSAVVLIAFAMVGAARAEADDLGALRAIGLRSRELAVVAAAPSIVAAVLGAVGAGFVAVAISPRMPIGLGRQAEVHRGVDLDLVVLGAGFVGLLGLGVLGAVLAARPTARAVGLQSGGSATRRTLADGLARAGAPLAPTLGARLLGRARGAPLRSALVTVAVAVAAIATVATFTSTLSHLVGSSTEQGAGWDLAMGNINLSDYSSEDFARLEAVPGIDGVTATAAPEVRGSVDDVDVAIAGIEQESGDVGPTIVTGRLPARDGEVLLGRHTATRLGVHEGDQVDVEAGAEGHVTATVVGTAVLNSNISPTMQIGDGALVSIAQLKEMIPDQRVTFLLAKISDGSDPDEVIASVNRTWGDDANAAPPLLSGDVVNLRRVRQLPIGLAFGLGVAALVLLAFALALSARRRRVELAVLRALGGTRRQASATLVWQGIWIALGAAAIGVPAGVIVGRAIWSRLSGDLGTITEPVVPWPQLLLLVAVGTAVTGMIATVPAVLASRRTLATTLRTE